MRLAHAIANSALPLCVFSLAGSAVAQSEIPPGASGNNLVKVASEASVAMIHPGDQFLLAFRFEIEPLWHIYWKNPGDTGMPTAIEIAAPEGFEVGDVIWPRPLLIPGMFTTYGYEDEATLFVPVTAPDTLDDGEAKFTASISWLVCQESCLMGDAAVEISIETSADPRAEGDPSGADEGALSDFRIETERVREWAKCFPRPLDRAEGAIIETIENRRIVLCGPAHGATVLTFFPCHSPGVSTSIEKQLIENDRFAMVLSVTVNPTATLDEPPTVAGVIALGTGSDDPSYSFEIALDE